MIASGAVVYARSCACHGRTGDGDGPAAAGLTPRPADLAWVSELPIGRWDSFLYWTISEGGVPFGAAMPAFKRTLSGQDRWLVISYIESELPQYSRRSGGGSRPRRAD
ncbi:MAG TPA: cytochrome c [Caulobacteraceae bacterium]|nr:cytochrome c [Caulobacteraceae bacterium]